MSDISLTSDSPNMLDVMVHCANNLDDPKCKDAFDTVIKAEVDYIFRETPVMAMIRKREAASQS